MNTLFDKIWDSHTVDRDDDENYLIYLDRVLVHDLSFHVFNHLRAANRTARNPDMVFSFADHFVPTVDREPDVIKPEMQQMMDLLAKNSAELGIRSFGLDDPDQGILHVVGPEQGITLPGLVIAGADSHTSTHGALGCFAFGAGVTDITHAITTQTLWRPRPGNIRVTVSGELGFSVTGKDVVLKIIETIGAAGGTGHVIEYAGEAIENMSIEERMTVCNMSIEAGARAGLVSPDDKTIDYVRGRPHAPTGKDWELAEAYWRTLATDTNASFDREVALHADDIAPMVTWGTSPEDAIAVTDLVPDPADESDANRRAKLERSLDYIGLTAGDRLTDVAIDHVFIGSCTNSRIEDLRAAAAVAKGRTAKVPAMIVPGSVPIQKQAESEGLDRIFTEAGFQWREPGCSMCVAINGDMLEPGTRCASTSNRNFEGRQGKGARTHLMSPAMAAAAAVSGKIADVREMMR